MRPLPIRSYDRSHLHGWIVLACLLAGCAPSHVAAQDASADRAIEQRTSFWDGQRWALESRMLSSYASPDGEATTLLTQAWRDTAWVNRAKEVWTLDAEGRHSVGTIAEWTEASWRETAQMAYTYDADGNKVRAQRSLVNATGHVTKADSLVSTFEAGVEAQRRFFSWTDGRWTEGLRQTSTYDEAGREVRRLHLVPDSGGWREQRRWTFQYNAAGSLASGKVEENASGTWTSWLDQTYEASDLQTAVVHREWTDETWTNWMRIVTRFEQGTTG